MTMMTNFTVEVATSIMKTRASLYKPTEKGDECFEFTKVKRKEEEKEE